MALTADQLNTIYQNVLFRNVDTAGIQFFANRSDISDAQVRQQIELSQEASTFVSPVVRLYQEVLGRVPDTAGLKFFSNQLRAGTSLDSVAQQLVSSAEFQTKTTATTGAIDTTDLTNTNQLVSDAFQSILGRTPAAGEFSFFQGKTAAQILSLVAGSPEAAQTNAAGVVTFLDSVAVGSPNGGTLNNQVPPNTNPNPNTPTVNGATIILTTSIDGPGASAPAVNTTGTAANDLYIGDNTTLTSDVINGGAGTDTLRVTSNGTGTFSPSLTSVERVEVSAFGTSATFNLQNSTGVTTVASNSGSASVALNGLAAIAAAEISNTTAGDFTLGYNAAAVAGSTDTQNLQLTGATVGTLTTQGIETLSVNAVSGTSKITTVTDAQLTTVNIAGAGNLTITNALTGATTVNAGTATGNVNVTLDPGKDVTVTGGKGNDVFNFGAGLTAQDTVNGGDGTDTVRVDSLAVLPTGNLSSKLTSVEILQIDTSAGGTINLDNLGGSTVTQLKFGDDLINNNALTASTTAITNGTTGQTIAVQLDGTAAGALTYALKTDGSTDVLTLNLQVTDTGGTASTSGLTAFTASGVETLNINSSKAVLAGVTNIDANDTSSIATLNATSATTLKLAGDSAISLGTTASSLTSLTSIDASTATKAVTLGAVGAAFSTSITGATVTTGSGDDFVSLNVGSTGVLKAIDLGGQTSSGGDTLALTSSGTGATIIDLSSTTDQVSQLLGSANTDAQKGIENVNLANLGGTAQITGSSAANIIVGTGGVDTINGGGGNDTITGGVGADEVAGGTGTNNFLFATGDTGTPTATNFDTITDYRTGTNNVVTFSNATAPTIVTNNTASNGTAAISANGVATFDAADNDLAKKLAAVEKGIQTGTATPGQTAIFQDGSDAYLFISNGTDSVQSGDVFVKLTGVTIGSGGLSITGNAISIA